MTGSGRRIRDSAADLHNLTLRWEKLNDEGFGVAANIVNIRRSVLICLIQIIYSNLPVPM